MYQLTQDPNQVIRLGDGSNIPRGHRWWDDYETWLAAGNTPEPWPGQSFAAYIEGATNAVQAWLDSTARQNNYDSIASCISYLNSTVPQYKADATAAIVWRDAVWQACYQMQQAQSVNPPNPLPTYDELIAQLPQPSAFGWIVHSAGDPTSAA